MISLENKNWFLLPVMTALPENNGDVMAKKKGIIVQVKISDVRTKSIFQDHSKFIRIKKKIEFLRTLMSLFYKSKSSIFTSF